MRVVAVVEGHGEVEALPILIRRLCARHDAEPVDIPRPIRINRGRLLKPNELERAVSLAARQTGPGDAILLLIDADDDCPAQLGPRMFERATASRSDRRLRVVLAKSEFEAWFLAAAESLQGRRGLPVDLTAPRDTESIRDAKGWLSQHMMHGSGYRPTIDQPGFAAVFDLGLAASRSPSFAKMCRDVEWLISSTHA